MTAERTRDSKGRFSSRPAESDLADVSAVPSFDTLLRMSREDLLSDAYRRNEYELAQLRDELTSQQTVIERLEAELLSCTSLRSRQAQRIDAEREEWKEALKAEKAKFKDDAKILNGLKYGMSQAHRALGEWAAEYGISFADMPLPDDYLATKITALSTALRYRFNKALEADLAKLIEQQSALAAVVAERDLVIKKYQALLHVIPPKPVERVVEVKVPVEVEVPRFVDRVVEVPKLHFIEPVLNRLGRVRGYRCSCGAVCDAQLHHGDKPLLKHV